MQSLSLSSTKNCIPVDYPLQRHRKATVFRQNLPWSHYSGPENIVPERLLPETYP